MRIAIIDRATRRRRSGMEKEKVFYVMISRKGLIGVEERRGLEIKIDGETFNAYASAGLVYIIDPKTGVAVSVHDCEYEGTLFPSMGFQEEIDFIRAAQEEMEEDRERFEKWKEKWRKKKRKGSYKLLVKMFKTYKKSGKVAKKA